MASIQILARQLVGQPLIISPTRLGISPRIRSLSTFTAASPSYRLPEQRRALATSRKQHTFSPYFVQNEIFVKKSAPGAGQAAGNKMFHDKDPKYKAVIFDKDGTLVCFHSMWTPWAKALNERMYRATGMDLSQSIYKLLGVCSQTFKTGPGLLAEGTKEQIKQALVQLLMTASHCYFPSLDEAAARKLVESNFEDGKVDQETLRQLHDLSRLFSTLRQHGVKVAVNTSDSRTATVSALQQLGILHLVDVLVCADDPDTMPKPHPQSAVNICEQLSVATDEVVMVGDTVTDMAYGKNAKLGGCIGVLSGIGVEEDLRANGADSVIPSVADILPHLLPDRMIPLSMASVEPRAWRLAIVDKDGTLADVHYRWSQWALEVGRRLATAVDDLGIGNGKVAASQFYALMGLCENSTRIQGGLLAHGTVLHMKESLLHMLLIIGVGLEQADAVMEKVWIDPREYPDRVLGDNVKEILHALKQQGLKVAINTSDTRECTERFLSEHKLTDMIDFCVTSTEAFRFPKPLPQSNLMICKQLLVSPEDAIFFGDSCADMLSARAARLGASVAVLSGASTVEHVLPHADILLPNFSYAPRLISTITRDPAKSAPGTFNNVQKRSYSTRASLLEFPQTSSRPTTTEKCEEHDYIVIGAGSAGCVLANRLSASNPNQSHSNAATVCVLEAGPEDTTWTIHMPAALMYNLCHDKFNWYYHTFPEPHMNNRRMYWPRGRVWGGSSALNAMVYVRGHPEDYNLWETLGAKGWSYYDCLPYFRKAQCHELGGDTYRGGSGPLHVSRGKSKHPLHDAWLQAGQQAGYPLSSDMNGFQQEGVAPMDLTVHKGVRWSAATAYLRPVLYRDNLTVQSNTMVHRVLFDGNRAVGVEVSNRQDETKQPHRIMARKEVILSSGSINSPQLLMLSGVGDAQHLREVGISNIVQHLPGVGRNLQEHLEVYVQQKCKQPITLYNAQWKFPQQMVSIGLEYFTQQTGWGATSHLETGGFVRTSPEVPHPNIQYHFLPSMVVDHGRSTGDCHAFQVHAGPMRSESRGRVWLRSSDPYEHPNMVANYMSTEKDLQELREAIRLAREIFAQPAFDPYRDGELLPGPDCQSDAQLNAFIRAKGDSAYHPSSTCRMGSPSDPETVVDPQCRVLGLEDLRVVDASIMPSIISGNLNAPTIMIAEKAADIILGRTPLAREMVPVWRPQHTHRQRDGEPVRKLWTSEQDHDPHAQKQQLRL